MEFYLNSSNEKARPYFNGYKNPAFREEMSLDTFKFFLDLFFLVQEDEYISLAGVEPLENPYITEILSLLNDYSKKKEFNNCFWTDGVNLCEYINLFPQNAHFEINIKSPEIIGNEKYKRLLFSLNELNERRKIVRKIFKHGEETIEANLIPTCSLIQEITDYSFFWNIVNKFQLKIARVSLTFPKENIDKKDFYLKMKPIFMNFIQEAFDRRVLLLYECNNIPPCFFKSDELAMISNCAYTGIQALGWCPNVYQVMPDRTVCFCPCLKSINKMKIKNIFDYKRAQSQLFSIRKQIEDKKYRENTECLECLLNKNEECFGGCLGLKGDLL